ncbi:hypothetical protein [Moorella stamsii]|uniref:hypothetical protein n=1 Tax=Neomoorella stamsii TaxID=1266720 RepID=UPI0006D572D8|nr:MULTISPECIES: hypothetical protein [Moorella]
MQPASQRDLGLIPDPLALMVAGDGSPLRTGTSPACVKVCHCREQGIFRCSCPHSYPDPDAIILSVGTATGIPISTVILFMS